jgi:ABC-type Zn2+ transport system substrate-binding protein/surface adhesin
MLIGLFITASYVQANEEEHKAEHQTEELAGKNEHPSHQHEIKHKEETHHEHGFKIMGVDFAIISGVLTLFSLLTTFTIGMLRRFGKKKLNMNLHHYAAYTTVALACIHAIYNLLTHV